MNEIRKKSYQGRRGRAVGKGERISRWVLSFNWLSIIIRLWMTSHCFFIWTQLALDTHPFNQIECHLVHCHRINYLIKNPLIIKIVHYISQIFQVRYKLHHNLPNMHASSYKVIYIWFVKCFNQNIFIWEGKHTIQYRDVVL